MGNSPKSTSEDNESVPEAPSRAYKIVGGTLAVSGGLLLLLQRYSTTELPAWLYYTAIGALILGVIEYSLGRMSREAAWEWNKSLVFALGFALLIRWPIAEPYRIPSGSMETTLHGDPDFGKGDRVFVNKFVYGVRYPFLNKRIWYGKAPERWDIVVFKSVEPDAEHPTLVKRIVGMPGEQIHISSGQVYINGEPLEIPDFMPEGQHYTSGFSMKYGIRPEPEFSEIPEGHYLVLGDNSANSRDGRYFGWLPNEHIVGQVASIWWPPPRWRDFTGFSRTLWWNGLLVVLVVYLVSRLFVGRSWPVLNDERDGIEHIYIDFLHYGIRIPMTPWNLLRWGKTSVGDMVLYRPVGDASNEVDLLLGRVVAQPGDEVTVEERRLLINGDDTLCGPIATLNDHNAEKPKKSKNKATSFIPEKHVFILTDIPEDSEALDSRRMGSIPASHLMGKAQYIWWPLIRARRIK